MEEVLKIPKSPKLNKGEDYAFLREEGIGLIQEYSGSTWSDHNLHDPGITLLEAYCYVLTELSLKANLDIKDILASSLPNSHQVLFPPEQILPSRPTAIRDFRKILMDLDGVRNGWMITIPTSGTSNVNGLFDVLIELDDHLQLGDLNSSILESAFTINFGGGEIRSYVMEVSFPPWDEVIPFQQSVIINSITSPGFASIVLTSTASDDQNDFLAELEVTYNGASTTTFSVTIRISPEIGADAAENIAVENEVINILSDAPGGGPADQSMMTIFNRKVSAASDIEQQVLTELMGNRNLCEDVRSIKAIRIQEIGLNVRIDILKSINLERYLAELLFEFEKFFKPIIERNSLKELEEKNISYEHIFDGPHLDNGFIEDSVLNDLPRGSADDRNSTVHVSDLVNIILKIALNNTNDTLSAIDNQIMAISSISISNYIRNIVVADDATDCLILAKPELFKPRFSYNKSKIKFFRNDIDVNYNIALVNVLLDELRANSLSTNSVSSSSVIPKGESLLIGDFHSIQHDFPSVYGLGRHVLTETYPIDRRSKVEQFRGYLTLIDHLLASFSNQLNHINDLFSIDPDVDDSYFKSALYNIPYYNRLLLAFINRVNSGQSWEGFQNDPLNVYPESLSGVFESRAVFLDRRNRFLDHLLGRFGASIESYISYRYEEASQIVIDSAELELRQMEISNDLISDKINYLKLYPELSRDRFKAHNYTDTAWDTINVSGMTKRLLSAIGLRNFNRRSFYDEVDTFIQIVGIAPNINFEILDKSASPILHGPANFPNAASARNAAIEVIKEGINRDNYYLNPPLVPANTEYLGIQTDPTILPAFLASVNDPLLVEIEEFEARKTIRQMIKEIKEIGSGVYIVEHILLRPDPELVAPLKLSIPAKDGTLVPNPYSMRITIVLPSGYEKDFSLDTNPVPTIPTQFQDDKFRHFVSRQIKEETPAHILTGVFWLDQNTVADLPDTPSLNNFSERWKAWLEAKQNPATPTLTLQNRRDELLVVLNGMYQL